MNRRVSVWKYVRLKNGRWRYCKPALGKNGTIRPDWIIVKGKPEHHPEGNFYLHISPSRRAMKPAPRLMPCGMESKDAVF